MENMPPPSVKVTIGQYEQRACKDVDPNVFFPHYKEKVYQGRAIAEAQKICADCVINEACFLGAEARGEPDGIWGGVSFYEPKRRRH